MFGGQKFLPWWMAVSNPLLLLIKILYEVFKSAPDVETKSIVILGMKGCGKTTLWRRLRGDKPQKGEEKPTSQSSIESFSVSGSYGRTVKISNTSDIGGDDSYVTHFYDSLINYGTMVYFLVDLCTIKDQETVRKIKARLRKIIEVAKVKELKETVCLKIVATHLDESGCTEDEAISKVISALGLKNDDKNVMALDLFDDNGFNRLKDEIVNAGINI